MPTLSATNLPPPLNWQDFEDLCCDLWSRIWNDPQTFRHGRSGQRQCGVDVYGRPEGGTKWVGVQCKLRSESLSRTDLEQEIELARTFKPVLSSFLIATTAPRDVAIQQTAREFTAAQIEAGSFSVSVFAWDDIRHHLSSYPDLVAKHYSYLTPFSAAQQPTPTGYRCLAPRPQAFVSRAEYQPILRHLLEAAADKGLRVAITTALVGAGGFGKTTLAQALCLDEQVRAAYPAGILWVTFGDQLTDRERLSRLRDLLRRWRGTESPNFETITAAGGYLCDILAGQRALLVADDVWSSADLLAFHDLGPASTLLLTTRNRRQLPVGCLSVNVDSMDPKEAMQLLGDGLPGLAQDRLRHLAKCLGEWPLLLSLVHWQISDRIEKERLSPEQALAEVEVLLAEEGLTAFDRDDVEAREFAVGRTLNASLRRLSDDELQCFEHLAIFPEDADLPFATLERLWDLTRRRTETLCRRFHQLSLVVRFDAGPRTIRLHDVVRHYLRNRRKNDLLSLNRRFLDACRPEGGWAALSAEEPYLWRGLAYHLAESDSREELRNLLLDFSWMEAKLTATDINNLLADYDVLLGDSEPRIVLEALRLAAHILADHPEELAGQLHGRLLDRSEPGITALLERARLSGSAPWLRPLSPSLTLPGCPLVRTLTGHSSWVRALAVLQDGRVVSASNDETLRVWDVVSGDSLQLAWGIGLVTDVAALPDGRVVSIDFFGTLRISDVVSGEETLLTLREWLLVLTWAVLPDGRIVSGSSDGSLRVWDLTSGRTLQTFEGHSDPILALIALPDGRVVSGSHDGTLQVWDLASQHPLHTFEAHSGSIMALAALPDGHRIVCGTSDGILWICDLSSGQSLQILQGHSDGVRAIAVLPDGWVVSGHEGGALRVWDVASEHILQTYHGHSGRVHALAVLPDGRVVSGADDATVRVWDTSCGETLLSLEGSLGPVYAITILPDNRAVSVFHDGTMRVLDLTTGTTLQTHRGYSVCSVATLTDGRFVSCSKDWTLRVWDAALGRPLQTIHGFSDNPWDSTSGLAVLLDGRVVSTSLDGALQIWDLGVGEILEIRETRLEDIPVEGLASGRDVSGAVAHILRGSDVASDEPVQIVETRVGGFPVIGLADGRVISGASDPILRVWDVASGNVSKTLQGHSGPVLALAILPDGQIVSASSDRTLRVWEVTSGETLQTLRGHSGPVHAVAILPEGLVVSGATDRTVRIWNPQSGQELASFTLDVPLSALALGDSMIVVGDRWGCLHRLVFESQA
jgi:WD40 repeat protein